MWSQLSEITQIAPGISLVCAAGGRISIYTLATVNRVSIDAFITAHLTELERWPQEIPSLVLYEGIGEFAFTPYISERLLQFTQLADRLGHTGRTAYVFENVLVGQIFQLMRKDRSRFAPNVSRRLFPTREAALNWLQQAL